MVPTTVVSFRHRPTRVRFPVYATATSIRQVTPRRHTVSLSGIQRVGRYGLPPRLAPCCIRAPVVLGCQWEQVRPSCIRIAQFLWDMASPARRSNVAVDIVSARDVCRLSGQCRRCAVVLGWQPVSFVGSVVHGEDICVRRRGVNVCHPSCVLL